MSVFGLYAKYYDLLYSDKEYKKEAIYIAGIIDKFSKNAKTILELGCGTGKHALELARSGYSVHGVDFSSSMIEQARSRISRDLKEFVAFDEGDVRKVRVNNKFDAIVSLFHVVSYQTTNDDLLDMFNTAALHLEKDGIFIFDCWYGPAVLTERPGVRVKYLSDECVSVTRVAEPVMYPNDNFVDVNYTIFIEDKKNGKLEKIAESHRMRYLFAPELIMLLKKSGFDIGSMFEWLTDKELGFSTWSATIVARKN